jgi:FlaA1/EpsC-like NDP-sugar epimerase
MAKGEDALSIATPDEAGDGRSSVLRRLGEAINHLPGRLFSASNQAVIDGLLSCLSIFLAFQLRFDGSVPATSQPGMWASLLLVLVLRPAGIWLGGGYHGTWRFFNLRDGLILAALAIPASLVLLLLRLTLATYSFYASIPITVVLIEYLLYVALAMGVRSFRRATFEAARPRSGRRLRALVVGNEATLAPALRQVSVLNDIQVVGLMAPETHLRGLRIGGFQVIDEPSALAKLLASKAVDLVLIADASLDCVGPTVSTAAEFGAEVRLLPSASNVIRGDVRIHTSPRPESVLMDRAVAQVAPHPAVVTALRERVVLVTGAGGSIGSEIARQVAGLDARRLILLDQDENSIFEIHGQLSEGGSSAELIPLVGDIRDTTLLRSVFERYQPDVVLHAAAYKHVPVMEQNCCEAILNNAVGTRNLLELTIRYGGERFLMISTDKAVRPSSVMGATKRLAEVLVQSRAAADPGISTRLACVRFGNVVGSRGSVVPIFLRQIAEGGPITITDEQMTRYFMTIPEAVQLVLQAATLGSRGDVYMLDMGDPIKITNLARKLIEMSGLRPDKDIEIRFTGARPGEKIHEQLWSEDAVVNPTEFPRVFAVQADGASTEFEHAFAELEQAAMARDESLARVLLEKMNIGYARPTRAALA